MTRERQLPPQTLRVLRSLRAVGGRGITRVDWLGPNTPDQGPAILNIPARILDLKQRGYTIDKLDERRDRCSVYVLKQEPHQPLLPADDPAAPHADRLFQPPAVDAIRGAA